MDFEKEHFRSNLTPAAVETVVQDNADFVQTVLPLKTKALYGVGEVSNSVKSFTFGLFLLFYYTSVRGLPGTLVGVATALSLVWDALIDPFIGHFSDRLHSRFGRRHPFMLVGALCMGTSFFVVFNPPAELSTTFLFAWLVITNILLRTTNSIFSVPYHALGAELSQDYHERTSITGIRAAFALFGTLIAAALSFVVFFPNTTPGVDPKFNLSGYSSMGLVFGMIIALAGLVATIGTVSQRLRPQATPPYSREHPHFLAGLVMSLRHPTFLMLTVSTSIFFLASVINATLAVHYLTYYARITQSSSLSLFQAAFFIGALPGVAFWVRVAKNVDKHRIYVGATLVLVFLMLAAYGLVGEGHLFGTGNIVPLIVGNSIGGFFASAVWIVPASMIADIADQDELAVGQRREGTFFGIHSFFLQDAAGVALLVSGVLIDHFAGLVPGQFEQSAQTINRLAMLFSLLPAALFFGAAGLMLNYRLTHQRVQTIQLELTQRRMEMT